MKYIVILCLLIISVYPFSYAKYNWDRKNKLGAVGSILIAVFMIIYPSIIILKR